jgi:hypothetical protein
MRGEPDLCVVIERRIERSAHRGPIHTRDIDVESIPGFWMQCRWQVPAVKLDVRFDPLCAPHSDKTDDERDDRA